MFVPSTEPCPICQLDADKIKVQDRGERLTYHCPRCGSFIITRSVIGQLIKRRPNYLLSAWIKERDYLGFWVEIDTSNINEIIEELPNYTPREKMTILMKNLETMSRYPGDDIRIDIIIDFPIAWADGLQEFLYYLQTLSDRGFISTDKPGRIYSDQSNYIEVVITADGWDYLEESEKRLEDKTQVFVAMSFSERMKPLWVNSIKPAIEDAGYRAYRIDAEPHIDRIDVKIIAEIKNSRFVVADVTDQKHGVYFEAGYAIGLDLPVIWMVREDDLDNVHFDTRQYNHIVWASEEDLKEQLYDVICAVIGKATES